MKFFKYLLFAVCFSILVSFSFVNAKSLTPDEVTSKDYIINHGHSPEVYRLIEIQEKRTLGLENSKQKSRPVKFLKNLYYERDLTSPFSDFGYFNIEVPETPSKRTIPKKIEKLINSNL